MAERLVEQGKMWVDKSAVAMLLSPGSLAIISSCPCRRDNGGTAGKQRREEEKKQSLVVKLMQWDQYRILHSGPLGPGCCNGENPYFSAQSGPFPDHFLNFSGPLVVLLV